MDVWCSLDGEFQYDLLTTLLPLDILVRVILLYHNSLSEADSELSLFLLPVCSAKLGLSMTSGSLSSTAEPSTASRSLARSEAESSLMSAAEPELL